MFLICFKDRCNLLGTRRIHVLAKSKRLASLHLLVSVVPTPEVLMKTIKFELLNYTKLYSAHSGCTDMYFVVAGFLRVREASDYIQQIQHVPIVPPANTEHVYKGHKHTHSLNVQIVCDSNSVICSVVGLYMVNSLYGKASFIATWRLRIWRWLAFRWVIRRFVKLLFALKKGECMYGIFPNSPWRTTATHAKPPQKYDCPIIVAAVINHINHLQNANHQNMQFSALHIQFNNHCLIS